MSLPDFGPAIPLTPWEAYKHAPYQYPWVEILPVVKIPIVGPAPYNTLAVVQSRAHITRYEWAGGDLSRRPVPIGNGLKLARFDPNDPRQRQVEHSSSAVIRQLQISDQWKDLLTDDDNTSFVLALDRVHASSSIDDYGQWSLTVDVADAAWQVIGFAYAEITSWVLCYEAPPAPGDPPDPPQAIHTSSLTAASLIMAYRDYALVPNAGVLKAAAELTQLDRQLSANDPIGAVAAEQAAVDILVAFTPPVAELLSYRIALAEAEHNLIARLVEVQRTDPIPALAGRAVADYLTYAHTPGADLTRAARDLAALGKPLLAAGSPADAAGAQQATVEVLELIGTAGPDRLDQLIGLAEARHNLVARLIDAGLLDRADAEAVIAIAGYQGYAVEPGADLARASADLTELARVVLDPAGLTEAAQAARQAAEQIEITPP